MDSMDEAILLVRTTDLAKIYMRWVKACETLGVNYSTSYRLVREKSGGVYFERDEWIVTIHPDTVEVDEVSR